MTGKVPVPDGWNCEMDTNARIDLIIQCVRSKKYVPFAESCVPYLGLRFIDNLIRAACDMDKAPAHRARLVDLIGTLQFPLNLQQILTLTQHRACKCKSVSEAIEKLPVAASMPGSPAIPLHAGTLIEMSKLRPRKKLRGSKNRDG